MKKIPTLFKRVYENHRIVDILPEVTEGMEWVLNGDGIATEKYDGSCCAIINRHLYKRYDAKNGKPIPKGAIKCQDKPDEITGHFPCWVKCEENNPTDKWFFEAEKQLSMWSNQGLCLSDGTYEAIGKHFQSNPYNLDYDCLVPHGNKIIELDRTFEGIKNYLRDNNIEGIVFWKDGDPKCKIKRTDFGFEWNNKK